MIGARRTYRPLVTMERGLVAPLRTESFPTRVVMPFDPLVDERRHALFGPAHMFTDDLYTGRRNYRLTVRPGPRYQGRRVAA
ncbi:MAG TPA: hypothetical protein VKU87_04365 [Thermomicrobiaceae bacterium]|nr:hypothetical protein [Thermomicrobiaceae bacterium]